MKSVQDLIQGAMDASGIGNDYRQYKVKKFWEEIVPQDMLRATTSVELKKGVLTVVLSSESYKTALDEMKGKVLLSVRSTFPEERVRKVSILLDDA